MKRIEMNERVGQVIQLVLDLQRKSSTNRGENVKGKRDGLVLELVLESRYGHNSWVACCTAGACQCGIRHVAIVVSDGMGCTGQPPADTDDAPIGRIIIYCNLIFVPLVWCSCIFAAGPKNDWRSVRASLRTPIRVYLYRCSALFMHGWPYHVTSWSDVRRRHACMHE